MSNESPEPYYRADAHLLAHVRAQGIFNWHPVEHDHSGSRTEADIPGHPRYCPNIGRIRINPDGTENWCNRNGLDKCGICDLNPFLD